ncbi:hypothetical protein HHI36_018122 [Cryptolaemus montrouzieri]|uniref:Endonuclease/exonuclease/phosphatase domain-containing protein n=1 Tax=Cryptolaemus montrouzieri TaxID=559131 RepID=A0ABD2NZB3_9CUCU
MQDLSIADGLIVYVKKDLQFIHRVVDISEVNALEINLNNTKIRILAAYRNQSVRESDFLISFRSYLEGLDGDCDVDITKGDMNIDILDTVGDDTQDYLMLMSEMGFTSCIYLPTRVTKISKTCIDHVFLKNEIGLEGCLPVVSKTSLTDHFPVSLQIFPGKN